MREEEKTSVSGGRRAARCVFAMLALACCALSCGTLRCAAQAASGAAGANAAELKIAGRDVQMLLIAPGGRKTGYEAKSGKIVRGIADSGYFEDALLAFDSGRADNSTTQTIDVRRPAAGDYKLMVMAGKLADGERYEVRATLYRADGGEAGTVRIDGKAWHGHAASYELKIAGAPGRLELLSGRRPGGRF